MFGILEWVSHQYLFYIISKSWKINWEQFTEFCFVTSAKRLHKLIQATNTWKSLKYLKSRDYFQIANLEQTVGEKKIKFSYHVLVWFVYFFIFLMIFSIWIKNCQSIQRRNHNKWIQRIQNDCISPNLQSTISTKTQGIKFPKWMGKLQHT